MEEFTVDQILASFKSKRYAVDDREFALNLFGVRNKNRESGTYDDWVGALTLVDGLWQIHLWEATVDPSPKYLESPINSSGTAILVPGQYIDVWKVDDHNGWCRTLCQRNGKVRVYRDSDRDKTLELYDSNIQTGMFGINFHWNKTSPYGKTDDHWTGSAGCQVFRYKSTHTRFMELVDRHESMYEGNHSYTLFDEKDIVAMPQADKFLVWAKWHGDNLPEVSVETHSERLGVVYRTVSKWHNDEEARLFLMDLAYTQGSEVAAQLLQSVLQEHGSYEGAIDSKVGPLTKRAANSVNGEELILRLFAFMAMWVRRNLTEEESAKLSRRSVDCFRLALGLK